MRNDPVLKGQVALAGRPTSGAYVRVHGPNGDFVGEARTDEDGTFKFHLPLGNWFVVAFAPGRPRVATEVMFTGEEPQDLIVDLGD